MFSTTIFFVTQQEKNSQTNPSDHKVSITNHPDHKVSILAIQSPSLFGCNQLMSRPSPLRSFFANLHCSTWAVSSNFLDPLMLSSVQFTKEELSVITPKDVVKWMSIKLYSMEYPDDEELLLNSSESILTSRSPA